MMNRTNQMLAALVAVQIVLAVAVFWPRSTQAGGEPLFPDLNGADISALRVLDSEGNSIYLARQAGAWVLPEAGDYPARADRVEELLDKLLNLRTDRLIAESAASHARLQVAETDFVRRIELTTNAGAAFTLFLGSSPQMANTHLRLSGQDRVYLGSGLSSFDASAQPLSYIETTYVSLASDQVTALTLRNAHGELTFRRDSEGAWTLADLTEEEAVNADEVGFLASRAAALNLSRPLGRQPNPAYGLDQPAATVRMEVQAEDGAIESHELLIGAQDPLTNDYIVKYSGSPYYAQVAAFAVQDFLNKTRADFILEPTPELEELLEFEPATPEP